MLFQGLSLRLPVARTEKELKHVCQVVKQGKALYNENPVEFFPGEGFQLASRGKPVYPETPVEYIPGEGKLWRGISMGMNEMFSVTPCSFQTEKDLKHCFHVVSRWKAL
ncbi:hypothetical protein Tsp_09800, partial [Trichinella spiralis]|uniref:hypothetical protein n=1 Tax=Trichinella spiralis TaxID=6334 RepID=UPI0001EFD7E1